MQGRGSGETLGGTSFSDFQLAAGEFVYHHTKIFANYHGKAFGAVSECLIYLQKPNLRSRARIVTHTQTSPARSHRRHAGWTLNMQVLLLHLVI